LTDLEEGTGKEAMRMSFLGTDSSWALVPDHMTSDLVGLSRNPLNMSQFESEMVQSFNKERGESTESKENIRVMSSA